MEKAAKELGGIDVLVYSVGIAMHTRFEDITELKKVHDTIFESNFYGAVWCIHFALPHLKKSKGTLIAMSSLTGQLPAPYVSLYSGAKNGLNGICSIRTLILKKSISCYKTINRVLGGIDK